MIVKRWMEVRDVILTTVLALVSLSMLFIPTRFGSPSDFNTARIRAEILAVDNTTLEKQVIVTSGDKHLTMQVASSPFRGEIIQGANMFIGKMAMDKLFTPGDFSLVTLTLNDAQDTIISNQVVDHDRIRVEFVLLLLFIALLIIYAGWTGFKAVVSFILTAAAIWIILIPGFLIGRPPVPLSLCFVSTMTGVIIFLIGGVSRMGLVAFLGAISGIGTTALLSLVSGSAFRIHGAVKPFAETLLYSGYPHLNLTSIFLAGIFIASSGAVMDIYMDIAASMREVQEKHPGIGRKTLTVSGLRVGRAVVGTMTTTLLLAYSGGYTFILMVFMAQVLR